MPRHGDPVVSVSGRDNGIYVERDGQGYVSILSRYDRPEVPYSASEWTEVRELPLTQLQVAEVAYEAVRAVRKTTNRRLPPWENLRDDDRIRVAATDYSVVAPRSRRASEVWAAVLWALREKEG